MEFLKAVDSSFEKAKVKFEALREDPTPDAHWALWIDCMREPARTFFSLHRTSRDDAKRRRSALRHKLVGASNPQRTDGKVSGNIRALGRLLGTTLARAAQASEFELAIASMVETSCSSSTDVAGNGATQSSERWPKPRNTQIDTAARREGCRGSKTFKMPRGNVARIPGGYAASRALGHEYGDESEKDSLLHSKGVGEGKQAQGSATL